MDLSLVMFKSDGTRRDFPLKKARTVIGRKSSCDLRIPLTSVSRQHCEIVVDDEQNARLRDLGSSNGTFHNSNRVQETTLSAGDELVIGPVVFVCVIDGVPQEISPVRTIVDETSGVPALSADMTESGGAALADPEVPLEELVIEDESASPTAELDEEEILDDPIAALEAMAEAESRAAEGDDDAGGGSDDGEDDDIQLLALDLDDESDDSRK